MSRRLLAGAALACALSIPPGADALARDCCPIVELRQYTMVPGKRDELISLFEERFIESQEATGMRIAATFRDLADPDRFVWVRGFTDMQTRHDALTAFYYGPVWQAYREQANATLADNDNVLLLHPAFAGSGFVLDGLVRPAVGAAAGGRLVTVTIYYLREDALPGFVAAFRRDLAPLLERSGARLLAQYVSDSSKNTFARLPVREKEHVFVSFAAFDDADGYVRQQRALAADERWRALLAAQAAAMERAPETLLLRPTPRSLVR
ncbi:NIPSNAP family protein [Massilia sp. LXY-6]|uniref:NIPSNAP family protein n=1 Tax=Massilia sp. LXY-6 TaxID=3379823 RepID=UPI003EDF9FAE